MGVLTTELERFINTYLKVNEFKDYGPNGLQVEGKKQVSKIITAVTACKRAIDEAILKKADALLVHHGIFWRGDSPTLTHIQAQRVRSIMGHNLNLFAYHLPLDAHPKVGNNIQLAQLLNIKKAQVMHGSEQGLVWFGKIKRQTIVQFQSHIDQTLDRKPLVVCRTENKTIETVAWCSGAGQDFLPWVAQQKDSLKIDAYLSGEISERTFHQSHEYDMPYFSIGHHASEKGGVIALGEVLKAQFPSLQVEFVDIPNPV